MHGRQHAYGIYDACTTKDDVDSVGEPESIKLEQNDAYSGLPPTDTADTKGVRMEDNVAYNACKTKDGSAGLYSVPNMRTFDVSTGESAGTDDIGTGTYDYVTVN